MKGKSIFKNMRSKTADPTTTPLFKDLATLLHKHEDHISMNTIEKWRSKNGYSSEYVQKLLLQFAIYFSNLYCSGHSNLEKYKMKKYDAKQLKDGTRIEYEHTDFGFIAEKITKDHLVEGDNYYVLLKEMEEKLELNK